MSLFRGMAYLMCHDMRSTISKKLLHARYTLLSFDVCVCVQEREKKKETNMSKYVFGEV